MAQRQRRRRQERRKEHSRREGWRTRHSLITGAGLTAGIAFGLAPPALADTITVDSNLDNGDGTCATGSCTLRDAVNDANSYQNSDDIVFASSLSGETITLGGSELYLYYPTYIYGPGADQLTISGNGNSRIFDVNQKYAGDPVLISGLTLTDGYGGLVGGAIYNYDSALTVIDSRLTGNVAGYGGGIANSGAYANGRLLTVAYSTIDHNYAFYNGGGIVAQDSFGEIGGSTFDHNYAGVGSGFGGGVSAYGGFIFDSSISGNEANAYGGGITAYYAGLYNTILANNSAFNFRDVYSIYPFGFYDLVEHPDGITVAGYNHIMGQDPQLGGLSNNGGTTPTLKPAAGSPVVDKGFSDVDGDQRGSPRTVDSPLVANATDIPTTPYNVVPNGTDIGSVELTLSEGPQPPPPPPAAVTPAKKKKKKCKKKKKHRSAEAAKKKKCKKKKKKRAVVARSADGITAAARVARLRDAWGAERTGRLRDARGVHRDASRDFRGGSHWPDGAWTIEDATPKR